MSQLGNSIDGQRQVVTPPRWWFHKKWLWIPILMISHVAFAIVFAKIGMAHSFRPEPSARSYTISCDARTPDLLLNGILSHTSEKGKSADQILKFLTEND